ncbi:hypothetical protein [Zavarzinia sp.]|uniref:hypothetical protein n=1 Tax=Zavarzinia sp. TaxID=2027920 RepID=UPI00356672DB
MYGEVKAMLFRIMPGGAEAAQIYLGLLCLLAILAVARRGLSWLPSLGILLVLGLAIEVADVVFLRQSARAAAPELLHFMLVPCVLHLFARLRWLKV